MFCDIIVNGDKMILEVNNVSLSYGTKKLLDNINLVIEENDKIGLIGVNGCGKSSLLSLLAFVKEPEKGSINLIGKKKISYMSQEINLNEELTINDYLNEILPNEEIKLFEAKTMLTQLEIFDFDKKIKELSGGSKRKVALGLTLARPSDLLILDEPTNHLDSKSIEFLEKFLIKTTKAIFLVTHDRYFLERCVNKIVELDHGNIFTYVANYDNYLILKQEREEYNEATSRKLNAFIRREYEYIKRGPQARQSKDKRRLENFKELTSNKKEISNKLEMSSLDTRMGKKTIEFYDVCYEINNKKLINNLSFNLNLNSRIGIIGDNGCGKTTLLDIIYGFKKPTSGTIEIGTTINFGYFRQENVELPYDKRILDYINSIATTIKTKDGYMTSTSMLERFLFDDPSIYIGKLSGGEKRRLYLLSILMKNPNVLLLDEPTNDLDVTTLSVLEEYLSEFNGVVIIVSHDRYFLDKTVDTIFYINDGNVIFYNGNYSDFYNEFKNSKKNVIVNTNTKQKTNNQVKLTFNEKKEFDNILNVIDSVESKIKEINDFININYSNYELCKSKYTIKEELEKEYEKLLERWEYLNNKYEESLK